LWGLVDIELKNTQHKSPSEVTNLLSTDVKAPTNSPSTVTMDVEGTLPCIYLNFVEYSKQFVVDFFILITHVWYQPQDVTGPHV
jgi:hypothetical protein